MAITVETFDEALALARDWVQAEFPDEPLTDDSYHGKWARVLGMVLWSEKASIADADADWPPSDASSTAALDAAAELLGLSNGAGGVGRLVATPATGGLGTITGNHGTIYAINSLLRGPDGVTFFELTVGQTIPGMGPGTAQVANAPVVAVTPGPAGNVATGTVLQWVTPPAGNVGGLVLTSNDGHGRALTGGSNGEQETGDGEGNAALLARIRDRLQDPPKGGTAPDWRTWAIAALKSDGTSAGIKTCYLYPRRNGTGTVTGVLTVAGSGTARKPSGPGPGSQINAVLAAWDTNRPVTTEGRQALPPYMPVGAACNVVVRIQPTIGHAFDWSDTSGVLTVTAWNAGTSKITASAAMPADFIAKIATSTLRVQVMRANQVLPDVVVIAQNGYDSMAHTITVVAPVPASWGTTPPANGDLLRSAGGAVMPIATAVLALVDALGPSRTSGYADPDQDPWDDTLRIEEIARAALDTTDSASALVAKDLAVTGAVPIPPTINGTAANVQAQDDGADPPQLLYLNSVVVTE